MNRRRLASPMLRRALALGLLVAGAGTALRAHAGEVAEAREEARPGLTGARAQELTRLRTELAAMNAEIDELKRRDRNVRDEARLRARLADAEALARRLTEAERATVNPVAAPVVTPGFRLEASTQDSPSDMEAKADILADRARRVGVAAAQVENRLGALRARQELKRRAGQLEQDPFAAFETSKRRVVSSGSLTTPMTGDTKTTTKGSEGAPRGGTDLSSGSSGATPPGTAGGTPAGSPGTTSGAPTTPDSPRTGVSNGTGSSSPIALPPSSGGLESSTSVSFQFRDALDPATLADIRRLEASGAPTARALALQRALTALKAEASALDAQARALRAAARAPSAGAAAPKSP